MRYCTRATAARSPASDVGRHFVRSASPRRSPARDYSSGASGESRVARSSSITASHRPGTGCRRSLSVGYQGIVEPRKPKRQSAVYGKQDESLLPRPPTKSTIAVERSRRGPAPQRARRSLHSRRSPPASGVSADPDLDATSSSSARQSPYLQIHPRCGHALERGGQDRERDRSQRPRVEINPPRHESPILGRGPVAASLSRQRSVRAGSAPGIPPAQGNPRSGAGRSRRFPAGTCRSNGASSASHGGCSSRIMASTTTTSGNERCIRLRSRRSHSRTQLLTRA